MMKIDYLVAGYVSHDLTPTGYRVGGTAAYSGRIAHMLGVQTAVFTSTVAGEEGLSTLPDGIAVCSIPAERTTTFKNIYTPSGRQQTLHAAANSIDAAEYPLTWPAPTILHLGPIANEVDVRLIAKFPDSLIGLTPQGWMRRWNEDGRVYAQEWEAAEEILPQATAVILSVEDLLNDAMLDQYRRLSKLLVLTRGYDGCTVFTKDAPPFHLPAPHVDEVEPTGAGDIFATAFFIRLHQSGGDYREAGRFANIVASQSVTQTGLEAKVVHIRDYLQKIGEL